MTIAKRKAISKKIRFEVLKRDSFTCQYCGAKAPDAILVIDHVKPVAAGGTSDIMNLVTSCEPCNQGKSKRELSDGSIVEKQRKQAEDLQSKREMIELMAEWQSGLMSAKTEEIKAAANLINENIGGGVTVSEYGEGVLKKLIVKYGFQEVLTAIRTAITEYVHKDPNFVFNKIGGVCEMRRREMESPGLARLYYVRGILRNRLGYTSDWKSIKLLTNAWKSGAPIEDLEELAKTVRNWTDFVEEMRGQYGAEI